jgi:hypothetical protein
MVLRGCEQQYSQHALCRERQLQRPDEAGDDQQGGQADDEIENQFSPEWFTRDEKDLGGTATYFNDHRKGWRRDAEKMTDDRGLLRCHGLGVGIAGRRRPGQFDKRHDPPAGAVKLADDEALLLDIGQQAPRTAQ